MAEQAPPTELYAETEVAVTGTPRERAEVSPNVKASSRSAYAPNQSRATAATPTSTRELSQRNPASEPSVQLSTLRAASPSPCMITTTEV